MRQGAIGRNAKSRPGPLRIALVAPVGRPVPALGYGPLELVVDGLARGLQELGHEVVLFAAEDSTCPVPRHPGLGLARNADIDSRKGELRFVLETYEALDDFDIVHDHTLIGPTYARAFPDLTVVTTNHGPWDDELSPIFAKLAAWTPIICISQSQAAATEVDTAAVIHHGIDFESIPVGAGDGKYFLFVGRMSPDKGPHIAARIAREQGVPLLLAGRVEEQEEHDYFAAEIKPLLGDDIEFIGEVRGRDKFDVMGSSIALLNPLQWEEPFGLVMIEALATGTPVIAFRRGSVPEIVKSGANGFVVDTEVEMASTLSSVGSIDRDRCRADVVERFAYQRMAKDHERLYRRILDRRLPSQAIAPQRGALDSRSPVVDLRPQGTAVTP